MLAPRAPGSDDVMHCRVCVVHTMSTYEDSSDLVQPSQDEFRVRRDKETAHLVAARRDKGETPTRRDIERRRTVMMKRGLSARRVSRP